MKFEDIEQYPYCNYILDIPLYDIDEGFERYFKQGLELQPDFQRNHVWSNTQRSAYVEHVLRGGGKQQLIVANKNDNSFVLLDGLQRLTTCFMFIRNQIPAFNTLYKDFEYSKNSGIRISMLCGIKFGILNLKTRLDILRWYKMLNAGGTVHSEDELNKVDILIQEELYK